jgi:hypothetical protein
MTLNYYVIVERYSFMNGVVDGSNPAAKNLLFTRQNKEVGR